MRSGKRRIDAKQTVISPNVEDHWPEAGRGSKRKLSCFYQIEERQERHAEQAGTGSVEPERHWRFHTGKDRV